MKPTAPLVLAIAAIAACAASLAGSWFSVDVRDPNNLPLMRWNYGLFSVTWSGPTVVGAAIITDNYTLQPGTASLLHITAALEGLGMFLGGFLVVAQLSDRTRRRFASRAPWLGVAASAFVIGASIWFMAAFPTTQATGMNGLIWMTTFWGSMPYFTHTTTEGTAFWGPGWAWYLSLTAGILFLTAAFLLAREQRGQPGSVESAEIQSRTP